MEEIVFSFSKCFTDFVKKRFIFNYFDLVIGFKVFVISFCN